LHVVTVVCLSLVGLAAFGGSHAGSYYALGVAVAAGLLIYEHSLVRPGDFSKLDAAFFTMNGVISIAFFICVLTERPINHGSIIILRARPIGGLRLFDRHEADDKLIGVLVNDPAYGAYTELSQVPRPLVDRLRHYFLTYKQLPGASGAGPVCEIADEYDAATARQVIRFAMEDYDAGFA